VKKTEEMNHYDCAAKQPKPVRQKKETFLLFNPFGEKLLASVGVKHVGTLAQVDNDKFDATVMIACEYQTSNILPPMVIFTQVCCAKLMTEWAKYSKGNFVDCSLF
jgi:hypothetical protein